MSTALASPCEQETRAMPHQAPYIAAMKDELDALGVAISKLEARAHLARQEARHRRHDEVYRLPRALRPSTRRR